jgi:hypothetical protein
MSLLSGFAENGLVSNPWSNDHLEAEPSVEDRSAPSICDNPTDLTEALEKIAIENSDIEDTEGEWNHIVYPSLIMYFMISFRP